MGDMSSELVIYEGYFEVVWIDIQPKGEFSKGLGAWVNVKNDFMDEGLILEL